MWGWLPVLWAKWRQRGAPKPFPVECDNCRRVVYLPYVYPDGYLVEPIDGWCIGIDTVMCDRCLGD